MGRAALASAFPAAEMEQAVDSRMSLSRGGCPRVEKMEKAWVGGGYHLRVIKKPVTDSYTGEIEEGPEN